MGGVGLLNSIFSVYMWFKFLSSDINNNTPFWFSWFMPVCLNGFLWIPIFMVWPLMFFAGSTTVNVTSFLSQMTYIGAYFGYWANLGGMAYTFYIAPTESKSTFASKSDATPYIAGYAGLSLLSSAISIIFVPDIVTFAD